MMLTDIPIVAISKGAERNSGREKIHMKNKQPLLLQPNDPILYFLQRLRDEAHRFAITLHRKRRSKSSTASRLDSIPGIGPHRRKQLLRKFGSMKMVQKASIEDIASLPGFTISLADRIKDRL